MQNEARNMNRDGGISLLYSVTGFQLKKRPVTNYA